MPIFGRSGLPDWTQGTATATNLSATVPFVGATLTSIDPTTGASLWVAGRGDFFTIAGIGGVMIASVNTANQITLVQPWPFATQTTQPYAIIRMAFPATGSIAKAITDLQNTGGASNPNTISVIDDGTARVALENVAGVPTIAVGPTGTALGSLLAAIQINAVTGVLSFPQGYFSGADWNRNRLINGGFDVWQNGLTFTVAVSTFVYVADQWKVQNQSATNTFAINRVAALTGFASQWAMQLTGVFDAGQRVVFAQPLEAQPIADLAGGTVAISFDINATTTAGTLTGLVWFSCNATIDDGGYANSTTQYAFTIPAGTGRVSVIIPAAQTANLKFGAQLRIAINQNGVGGTVAISLGGMQLEKGPLANPFSPKPIQQEIRDCERYFQSSYDLNVAPGTAPALTGFGSVTQIACIYASVQCSFKTKMRNDPTIFLYSSNSGTVGKMFNATLSADLAAIVNYFNQNGFITIVNNVSVAVNSYVLAAWSANSRLV